MQRSRLSRLPEPRRAAGHAALAGVLAVLSAGCSGKGGGHEPAAPVRVVAARESAVPAEIAAIGTVTPIKSIPVKARVDGQILEIAVREGGDVRQGELMLRIDPRPFEVQRDIAAANLARDEALLAKAQDILKRSDDLVAKGYISTNQYLDTQSDAKAAAAAADADRAALMNARLNLEFATLRSPIDGRVGRFLLQQGSLVKANADNPLFTINQLDPIYVDFAVPERFVGDLRGAEQRGDVEVALKAEGAAGTTLERSGRLTFVDNQVDAASGTVRVRATIVNGDRAFWPGQFVRVSVRVPAGGPVLWVPASALGQGPEGAYVYVVGDRPVAQQRAVRVARSEGERVVIAAGLKAGERVVVDGQSRILPGGPVTVVDTPAVAADGAPPPAAGPALSGR